MKISWIVSAVVAVSVVTSVVQAAPGKGYAARINVKEKLDKERDSTKDERENSSTKTKTETQQYKLAVTVANTVKKEGTFDLEWYFLKRDLSSDGKKGDPVVCEKDKTSVTIGGMKRVSHPLESAPLSWREVKTEKSSSKSNSSSSGGKTYGGSLYGGYVILVKLDGEILAKYSNDKRFLSDEWLGRLDMPVQSGSRSLGATSGKKKKNKKNKK